MTPWRWVVMVGWAAMLAFAAAVAQAEEGPSPNIDERTARIINEAVLRLNEDDQPGAREELGKLKLDRLSPYERSRVEQILAGIDSNEGRYESALAHLHEAVDAGGLNELEVSQVIYNIAQLYAVQEKWLQVTQTLETWFRTVADPNSAAYYLLALAYYQQDQLDKALMPAQKAVDLVQQPQVSWLQLLLSLRLQREEYAEAGALLERLLTVDPANRNYWMQLSAVYGQLEDYEKSLAVLRVAHAAGLLTEPPDLLRLADLLAMNGVPYVCAEVLGAVLGSNEAGRDVDAYEKAANCWIAAGDYDAAVSPLLAAARLTEDGKLFLRLGELHIQREDWQAAIEALRNAIDRGGLEDVGQAYVLSGIAHFKQGTLTAASDWFGRAVDSERHGKLAHGYLQLIRANAGEPVAAVDRRS